MQVQPFDNDSGGARAASSSEGESTLVTPDDGDDQDDQTWAREVCTSADATVANFDVESDGSARARARSSGVFGRQLTVTSGSYDVIETTRTHQARAEQIAKEGLALVLGTPLMSDWRTCYKFLVEEKGDLLAELWPWFVWVCDLTTRPLYMKILLGTTLYSALAFIGCAMLYPEFGADMIGNVVAASMMAIGSPVHAGVIKSNAWHGTMTGDDPNNLGLYEVLDAQVRYFARFNSTNNDTKARTGRLETLCKVLYGLALFSGIYYLSYDQLEVFFFFAGSDDELEKGRVLFHYVTGMAVIFRLAMTMGALVLANMCASVMHCSASNAEVLSSIADRFEPLRLLTEDELDASHSHVPLSAVTRDGFERYLLGIHFLDVSSDLWKALMILWLTLSGLMFLLTAFLTFLGYPNAVVLFLSLVFFFWPVSGVAYCNSMANRMTKRIRTAAPDDHVLIGGRDKWLDFLSQVPAFWHIAGFAITPSWLAGFAGGATMTMTLLVMETLVVTTNQ